MSYNSIHSSSQKNLVQETFNNVDLKDGSQIANGRKWSLVEAGSAVYEKIKSLIKRFFAWISSFLSEKTLGESPSAPSQLQVPNSGASSIHNDPSAIPAEDSETKPLGKDQLKFGSNPEKIPEKNSSVGTADMSVVCNITVTVQQPQITTFGELQGAPVGHPSYSIPMSLTKLICDAKFSGLQPSCGTPKGFDTRFTLNPICPNDQKLNDLGKKILLGQIVDDIEQNDPYCPCGSITDPQLFKLMQNKVLVALNYDMESLSNPYTFTWKVNGQEV